MLVFTNFITFPYILMVYSVVVVRRDSTVGIVTRFGLDGPGIESRWGSRYSAPGQNGPGAHPASYTMGNVSFPGI
jgi:hypothetical protein